MTNNTTKNFIIEKANQLFLDLGYQNVTVIDICDACDISKTTFYYHLKSKEEIILNFYDALSHNISQHLLYVFSKDNYWDQLVMLYKFLITEATKFGTDFFSQMLISNLKEDVGSFDPKNELSNVALKLIKKGQASGQIRNQTDAKKLLNITSFIYLGSEVYWSIKKGKLNWFEEMQKAMEIIFDVSPKLRKFSV